MAGSISNQRQAIIRLLQETRNINITPDVWSGIESSTPVEHAGSAEHGNNLLDHLERFADILRNTGHTLEADALSEVHEAGTTPTDFGGLGLSKNNHALSEQDVSELLFLVSAHLEALNAAERASSPVSPLSTRPPGRRAMTLTEKILAAHDVERKGEVKPGDIIRVDVDWVMASELSWVGMERWYDRFGKPGIFRNDRFWLAGDHLVDPRIMNHPKIQPFVKASERAKKDFKMTDNQGMNYTIMHTEFCRERAQPGMLIIGSDSHTCSAGSVSSLAIGLGVADVLLPLVTGETWFKVPETVEIRFINEPKLGLSGKDVILYILKELKRNTVAAERVVEYTGPGLKHLSRDARFAIANMTTEFGGVSGIFVPDGTTQEFVNKRKKPKHKANAVYFRPDQDAEYAESHIIDLSQVESFVARFPKPDDVVPVKEVEGLKLQGCFIGACTTAEEDLVLAALVLEEAMKRGARPVSTGTRKVVPGSLPILHKMRTSGLVEIYERAGWEVGVPSCSYCVGASADKAAKGETWLTSQNRNFENRMGPGAFGNLASAVTVAASSFEMKITNPASLLDSIDIDRVHNILGFSTRRSIFPDPDYVEPGFRVDGRSIEQKAAVRRNDISDNEEPHLRTDGNVSLETTQGREGLSAGGSLPLGAKVSESTAPEPNHSSSIIRGSAYMLGDFIDTDALAPAEALVQADMTNAKLGAYCLKYTHPDFRECVAKGQNIVVAGEGFGCGSSREDAVPALQSAGVQCVIAKSFAFIYARNQPNLGLLGVEMRESRFWELIEHKKNVKIDLDRLLVEVEVDGQSAWESFPFQLSQMQRRLLDCGGVEKAFGRYGKGLWEALTAPRHGLGLVDTSKFGQLDVDSESARIDW